MSKAIPLRPSRRPQPRPPSSPSHDSDDAISGGEYEQILSEFNPRRQLAGYVSDTKNLRSRSRKWTHADELVEDKHLQSHHNPAVLRAGSQSPLKRRSESVEPDLLSKVLKRPKLEPLQQNEELIGKRNQKQNQKQIVSASPDRFQFRKEDLLAKPITLLQQLIHKFNNAHKKKVADALTANQISVSWSGRTSPNSTRIQSLNKQWYYETGLKRGGVGFAIRRLPVHPSDKVQSWQAIFSAQAAAEEFLKACTMTRKHSRRFLERCARIIVKQKGAEVMFIADPPNKSVPLDNLKSQELEALGKSDQTRELECSYEIFLQGPSHSKVQVKPMTNSSTTFRSSVKACPPGRWHRTLTSNVLAPNNKKLTAWPALNEEADERKQRLMEKELREHFSQVNPESRRKQQAPILDLQAQQLRKDVIEPYLEATLKNRVSEDVTAQHLVLHYFLNTKSSFDGPMPAAICSMWNGRKHLDRTRGKHVKAAARLPQATDAQLAAAVIVCEAFEQVMGFNLWYFIKPVAEQLFSQPRRTPRITEENWTSFICRQCCRIMCPEHGTLSEGQDWDEHQPDLINKREYFRGQDHPDKPENAATTSRRRRRDIPLVPSKKETFIPCSHTGDCEGNKACRCFINNRTCEKFCHCSSKCDRRFSGCSCARTGSICFSKECICWANDRECDGDLCGKCGAHEVLAPDAIRMRDDSILVGRCANVSIQRGFPRRTILGESTVRDNGLYMGEPVQKNDFLGEYKGEIVSKGESARRGVSYHYQDAQYLWNVNEQQEIDATRAGNKFRFPNHSGDPATINMAPKVKLCNGVLRVGFWATRAIQPGEELFFNYGYPENHTKDFWEPGGKAGSSNLAAQKSSIVATKMVVPTSSSSSKRKRRPMSTVKVQDMLADFKNKGGRPQARKTVANSDSSDEDYLENAGLGQEEIAHISSTSKQKSSKSTRSSLLHRQVQHEKGSLAVQATPRAGAGKRKGKAAQAAAATMMTRTSTRTLSKGRPVELESDDQDGDNEEEEEEEEEEDDDDDNDNNGQRAGSEGSGSEVVVVASSATRRQHGRRH